MCYIIVFFGGCLRLLTVLSLPFCLLFCLCLFLSVFVGGFCPHDMPPVNTRDSTNLPCTSSPNLVFWLSFVVRAWTHDWQRSFTARFVSYPCPNPQLCSPAPIHTHTYTPWVYTGIPNPLSCACHVVLHFDKFCHVVYGGLAWVSGVFACVFWGVFP